MAKSVLTHIEAFATFVLSMAEWPLGKKRGDMLIFTNPTIWKVCKNSGVARGSYQRDFINGHARMSGSEIKKFGGRYKNSRISVIERIENLGFELACVTGKNNRLYCIVGMTADEALEFAENNDIDEFWE